MRFARKKRQTGRNGIKVIWRTEGCRVKESVSVTPEAWKIYWLYENPHKSVLACKFRNVPDRLAQDESDVLWNQNVTAAMSDIKAF